MKSQISALTKKIKSRFYQSLYLLLALIVLSSHDLYVKMETYFFEPNQQATLSLYNGTFEKSENIITRDRMSDASLVSQGKRTAINPDQWQDQDSTITQLTFNSGEAGTYMVGVATRPRNLAQTGESFNTYLEHDGVLDMLEYRTQNDLLDQEVVESYEKHVKAIYQVGDTKTNDWSTELGYPLEFVPISNPYEKYSGDTLDVRLLLDGKPLANQLVYADYIKGSGEKSHSHDGTEHSHDNADHSHDDQEEPHTHTSGQKLRTNDQGIVSVNLSEEGIYYIRTIHMVSITDSDELTHQSKWATLTFEVTHEHGASTHTHDHEEGVPTWAFVVGSLLIMGLLFLVFRRKN